MRTATYAAVVVVGLAVSVAAQGVVLIWRTLTRDDLYDVEADE
jgi:hypothetical protein